MTTMRLTMIEKVAEAIWRHMFPERDAEAWRELARSDSRLAACYLDCARAALSVLREPTEEMLRLGAYNNEGCLSDGCDAKAIARHCWGTMIDAAIKGEG